VSAGNSTQSGLRQIFSSIEEGKEPEHEHEQRHKVDLLSE
jgi:hypothetical protein